MGAASVSGPLGLSGSDAEQSLAWGMADAFEALPFDASEWDAAVERLGGSVYMTWDWLRTWLAFYGEGCRLRLFWFRKEGDLVGLLPVYIQQVGVPPFRSNVARLVGANIPPKVFDPPLHVEWAGSCLKLVGAALAKEGVDVCSVGPISETHRALGSWDPPASADGGALRWCRKSAGVHSLFELASSWDEYVARLGKNEQKRRKYELRLLRKEYPIRMELYRDPGAELLAAFRRFVALHTEQWETEGLTGHFRAWPHGEPYNFALVETQARKGRTRLMEVWAGDCLICAQYAYSWGERWYWELPARAVGPTWSRFSLGPTGLALLLAEAIREQRKTVEGGLGHYEYKLRLGAREHKVWTFYGLAAGRAAAARRLGARAWQKLLQYGYHRLWYRRIQPRLPRDWRRPQWMLWLRNDY